MPQMPRTLPRSPRPPAIAEPPRDVFHFRRKPDRPAMPIRCWPPHLLQPDPPPAGGLRPPQQSVAESASWLPLYSSGARGRKSRRACQRDDAASEFTAPGRFSGILQGLVPWHITKLPLWVPQVGSPAPPVKVHVPTTTPLLRVPVVVGVPFEVPVRFPVIVSVLPAGVTDTTLKFSVPVTWFAEPVIRVASPVSVEPLMLAKHFPRLKKEKPLMSSGPVFSTENSVVKFNRLA